MPEIQEPTILSEVPVEDRIPPGSVIRVVATTSDFDARLHEEYAVEAYVPIDEGDAEPPQPYYVLTELDEGNEYYANAHQVVLVRSAAEQADRMKTPDAKEVMEMVASGLHSSFGGELEVYETTLLTKPRDEDDIFEAPNTFDFGVEFAGRRAGGARFAGTLRLTGLYRADY